MRALSRERNGPGDLTKVEVRAAVDTTDEYQNDEAGAFNSTLPTRARTALSARQKSHLFRAVSEKRYGVL